MPDQYDQRNDVQHERFRPTCSKCVLKRKMLHIFSQTLAARQLVQRLAPLCEGKIVTQSYIIDFECLRAASIPFTSHFEGLS